jgi:hypothetical protein
MRRYKQPNQRSRFSYACLLREDGLHYRLARRDVNGRPHFATHTFPHGFNVRIAALVLRDKRRELLERVDAIDLRLLGLVA